MEEQIVSESSADGDTVIDIIDVRKSYQRGGMEIPILNGIDLTVRSGEFLAIMGPSGSGKSTLMNMIGCLDRPTSGQIFVKGQDINQISDNELAHLRGREIGFVFQTFNLIPRLTAYQNVELPTFATKKNGTVVSTKVRDLLELVGLEDRMDHKTTELSGGQCQRVAIARALINDPMLILADEPTGNLDSKTTGEIMKMFSDLHEQGRTIVMITHDPDIAEFADRIVLVKDGVIENN
ncbi:MAG: ABC transporter ATP-binding protein [ANME-2 cluster archaeon]|nr:ABC transporter ATP-binding protein [ANME-2 cluster archaeon]MBC2699857.1 ABC transporter ATP-binding protein [ANME-2 cluster archaeon]MBC2708278.1 ABC transporter ATP-binding protein [ANME-2 cluster archaeon]MBC2762764.1 ABC transporter ATP-binding protein [ANME-2 cluster archaeon]